MSDLRDLYQEVIFDHNKNPRNYGRLENPNRQAEGDNPLCGDQLTVYLHVDDNDTISDVSFEGSGCAISVASASLMSQVLKGKSRAEAEELFERFQKVCTGEIEPDTDALGKLAVFAGVRDYPSRVKCATLSWHTVHAALDSEDEQPVSITTE